MKKRGQHFHLHYLLTMEFLYKIILEENKDLLCKIFIETPLWYKTPVNAKASSEIELPLSTTLSLLIEQSQEIERLGLLAKMRINL